MGFQTEFNSLAYAVHRNSVDKGFWQFSAGNQDPVGNDGEKIALMHSELSEALEAHRNGNPPDDKIPEFTGVEAELADTIIRIMDYAEAKGFDVAGAIEAKVAYNSTRPYKHGKAY